MTRIEMDAEEFNEFLRCLLNLKEICNDVDIREGKIRQRSNDLTSVFEMDLERRMKNDGKEKHIWHVVIFLRISKEDSFGLNTNISEFFNINDKG